MYFTEWQKQNKSLKGCVEFDRKFSFMVSKREILVTKETPVDVSLLITRYFLLLLQKHHRHQFKEVVIRCVASEMSFLCVFVITCFGFSKKIMNNRVLFFITKWLFSRAEGVALGQFFKIESIFVNFILPGGVDSISRNRVEFIYVLRENVMIFYFVILRTLWLWILCIWFNQIVSLAFASWSIADFSFVCKG